MSETPAIPAVAPADDSQAIRQMREHMRTLEQSLKAEQEEKNAAQAKLTELERAKLDEIDRLKIEREELLSQAKQAKEYQSRLEQNETVLNSMFETKLKALPDDKQAAAAAICKGSAAEKLTSLDMFAAALGVAPTSAGTSTNPSTPGLPQIAPEAPKAVSPADWGKIDLREAVLGGPKPDFVPGETFRVDSNGRLTKIKVG